MGFYVNLEMPKDCPMCPFGHYDMFNTFCGCDITRGKRHAVKNDKDYAESSTRPDWCPLVPVPPHGIIDREQILDAIRLELAQANAVNDMEDYDSWMRVFDYVRKFPTVIPESEEGET